MIRNLQATICLVIGLIFVSSFAWASSDRIGLAGPLTFGKTAFELAWSNQPSYQYYVQKYLPKGETLEDFSQQLAIHLVITNAKPEAAVQEQIRYLDERQDSFDPVVNYAVSKSPDGEYMLDFLVSEIEDDCLTLVEFNIYRYKQIRLSNNQPALIIYTYSARSYDDQIIPFLESLVSERVGYLNQMILSEIPSVEIGIYPFPNK